MVGFLVSCDENQRRVTCKQLTYALHDQVKELAPVAGRGAKDDDGDHDGELSVRDALRLEVEAARRDNSSDPDQRLCRAHTGVKGLALLAGRPSALACLDPLVVTRSVFAKALAEGLPPVLHVYRLMPLQRICKGDAASVTGAVQELCGLMPARLAPGLRPAAKRPRMASEEGAAEGSQPQLGPSPAGLGTDCADASAAAGDLGGAAAGAAASAVPGEAAAATTGQDEVADATEAAGNQVASTPRESKDSGSPHGKPDEAEPTRAPTAPLPVWGCGLAAGAPASTFSVRARSRHNSGLKMHAAEMAGVAGVPAPHRRVGPSHCPQWLVLVEVFGTTAGVAIVPAEADAATSGFNLAAATETEQERHAKHAARTRAAGMTLEEAQAAVAAEFAAENGTTPTPAAPAGSNE